MASFGLDISGDDSSDGSSSLVSSILQSATSLGNSYILSQSAPNPVLSYPIAPPNTVGYGGLRSPFSTTGSSSGSGMLILFIALLAALFFFVKK